MGTNDADPPEVTSAPSSLTTSPAETRTSLHFDFSSPQLASVTRPSLDFGNLHTHLSPRPTPQPPVADATIADQQQLLQTLNTTLQQLTELIQNQTTASPQDTPFDVKAAMDFLVTKKKSVKNKRDFNEIFELEIIFRFNEQLTPSERAFFHERVRLLVIALQYNWRVAAGNATGTAVRGIVAHSTHLF